MVFFVVVVNYGLFTTFRTVLVRVRLVHIQPIHAELLKGHDVIFSVLRLELLQACFQLLFGSFKLLDGKPLAVAPLEFLDALHDLPDLLLKQPFLPLMGDGNLLKLAVSDDHRVIIAGCDPRAELLAPALFKVLFGRYQNLCRWIEPQEFGRPLLCQVIRHDEHALLA